MNWNEVEKSLRDDVARIRKDMETIPASAVATNASAGAAALTLGLLADAIARGRSNGGNG